MDQRYPPTGRRGVPESTERASLPVPRPFRSGRTRLLPRGNVHAGPGGPVVADRGRDADQRSASRSPISASAENKASVSAADAAAGGRWAITPMSPPEDWFTENWPAVL